MAKSQSRSQNIHDLSRTPGISWPAMFLFIISLGLYAAVSALAISGVLSLWAASLLNGFILYLLFSPMHEALHRTLSTNRFLNETIGRISLAAFIPAAPLEIARWIHLKHHAYTTHDIDPDNFMHHGPWYVLPLRWANFDIYYLAAFFRADEKSVRQRRPVVFLYLLSFAALIAGFIFAGLFFEFVVLWFLPTRIALALVGFVFVFLPHYPAQISAKEDKYKATTIRLGKEWLLTPLMVYQNYHLIHHLYPSVPFYKYIKVWNLRRDELIQKNPAIQNGLKLRPSWK